MSTTTPSSERRPAMSLDLSNTPRVPFLRLTRTELRKTYDTRAGFWLLLSIVGVTALFIVIFFLTADQSDRTFYNFFGITGTPQGFLLPVLGILLVTSEWGQRTTLTTFALEPSRSRVIAAKVVAALVLGLAAIVVAALTAAAATAVGGSGDAWKDVTAGTFVRFGILQISGILLGLAFGLLLLNSAAAIVLQFVLPLAFTIIATLWSALNDAAPWVDINTAQQPLFDTSALSGKEWQQLAVASTIWIIAPFVAGLVRVLRAEVK